MRQSPYPHIIRSLTTKFWEYMFKIFGIPPDVVIFRKFDSTIDPSPPLLLDNLRLHIAPREQTPATSMPFHVTISYSYPNNIVNHRVRRKKNCVLKFSINPALIVAKRRREQKVYCQKELWHCMCFRHCAR